MLKTKMTCTRVISYICALLMLGILVTQFLPFWVYGDPAKSVSINGYVWFPDKHTALSKMLQSFFLEPVKVKLVVNSIVSTSVLVLVASALSAVVLVFKSKDALYSLLPLATGAIGAYQYLGNGLFQLGMNWQIHLVLCIVAMVVAAVNLVLFAIDYFKGQKL